MDRIKVLQVEDSINYQVLFRQATKKNIDITLVATIEDLKSLSRAELQSIHLVILDGQLPDGTGMDVIHYLNSLDLSIPIIANSSSEQYNQAMISLGAKWSFNKSDFPREIKLILSQIQLLANSSSK